MWLAVVWFGSLASTSWSFKVLSDTNANKSFEASANDVDTEDTNSRYGWPSVAFWSPAAKRYLAMNKNKKAMTATARGSPLDLPFHWTYERFIVVDGGGGKVAFHNSVNNRFIKMDGKMMRSPIKAARDLPGHWDKERFRIVDAGDGMIALHSPANNRFITMDGNGNVRASSKKNWNALPANWNLERFYAVPARPYLEPGSVVALHSKKHGRCIRMTKDKMETTKTGKNIPKNWPREKFTVVDAGNGMVALHNAHSNRFVSMRDKGMGTTPEKAANALPSKWGWERFVVIPTKPQENEIALWQPDHNRFLRVNDKGGCDRSSKKSPQDLPHDWSWERFTVVKIADAPS
ncbi:unnamed protein product [Symbiodinium sp. CCMP2592]|nr:unnamed protein product [Symbiodinium sp. CCMP2592]